MSAHPDRITIACDTPEKLLATGGTQSPRELAEFAAAWRRDLAELDRLRNTWERDDQ